MKVLIGQFSHESNSFCQDLTTEADFALWELVRGQEVIQRHRGKKTVLGAFIEKLEAHGHEILPVVSASTLPSGAVEAGFYRGIVADFTAAARENPDLDAVLLDLHGAMSVEASAGAHDPEGELIAAIRDVIGDSLPICAVFDPHSDTTALQLESADLTLSYNEEPHRDAYDRGLEICDRLFQIARGEIHPVAARERAPMLLPAINMASDQGPMVALHQLREELEATPGVLDISIHMGFYGTNSVSQGFSVVCSADNDPALARRLAKQVAAAAWRIRHEFIVELVSIDDAVQRALDADEPIGLIDEADDPAGGGSADSVAILRGMIAAGVSSGGVSTVMDAAAARQMAAAGVGAEMQLSLGAKTDSLHGEPISVRGVVRLIHRDPLPMEFWSGLTYDVGLVCVLDVAGILVVVTERKIVTENIDIFELLGFDVRAMQMAVFKGLGLHIRQALEGKIRRFLPVDAVGVTHPDVRQLGDFDQVLRPIYPLDDMPDDAYP